MSDLKDAKKKIDDGATQQKATDQVAMCEGCAHKAAKMEEGGKRLQDA
jgi:hypothetical protein